MTDTTQPVIASVHLADLGVASALAFLRRTPKPASIEGLRHANVALAAPLRGSKRRSLPLRRVGLIAFWDDEAALDRFMATHPIAAKLSNGWHARLEPLRAWGSWPGLPHDLTTSRGGDHDGPALVLTLGRLRLTQTVRFLRASSRAETRATESPGLIWATALARPPFVATCSLWSSVRDLAAYAYGSDPAHPDAIAAHQAKPFHHESAFVRFRPFAAHGRLEGKNPLAQHALSA